MITEAIPGIQPDTIPAITIVWIVTIIGIVNIDFSAIVMIVTIKWTLGLSNTTPSTGRGD